MNFNSDHKPTSLRGWAARLVFPCLFLLGATNPLRAAQAQDGLVSRAFVTASIDRIRAFDSDGKVTNDFKIASVTDQGEINDVARLPDGRFVAHASFYSAYSRIIICTAIDPTTATCSEHPVRPPAFPYKFSLRGDFLYFSSNGSSAEPGDGIVRFNLNDYSSTLLPISTGTVVAGHDGLLYRYQHSTGLLSAFDETSMQKVREVSIPVKWSDLGDSIAVDAEGFIYVSEGLWSAALIKLNPQGREVSRINFPNNIFSFRISADGYLLVNNLFKDPSRPSYPFRWETLLLNSDLEVQWRRAVGRSPVGAVAELACSRWPMTLRAQTEGEPKIAKGKRLQDMVFFVRNNDSSLCGAQAMSLSVPSTTYPMVLERTSFVLSAGQHVTVRGRVEAPVEFEGVSRFQLVADGEEPQAWVRREVSVSLASPVQTIRPGAEKAPRYVVPGSPRALKAKATLERVTVSWRPPTQGAPAVRYLLYVNGNFAASVVGTTFNYKRKRKVRGSVSFSVRAVDANDVMSDEVRVRVSLRG